MATNQYPLRFTAQLRQHLRALRTKRGLTQAQLGAIIGVSQARIAEIEANPGLVRFEQMMQILSTLDTTILLSEDEVAPAGNDRKEAQATPSAKRIRKPAPKAVVGSVSQASAGNTGIENPSRLNAAASGQDQSHTIDEMRRIPETTTSTERLLRDIAALGACRT
ncbi:transcriptional regulator [Massilia glaciei]|uniref:Transcriptional regulator n=2 Tax=Massilia glaciei TaxID=1524097 RepID=A0A2U2HJ09_9BURK|nr:transcriptional regulator [Massilia glaciei]